MSNKVVPAVVLTAVAVGMIAFAKKQMHQAKDRTRRRNDTPTEDLSSRGEALLTPT